MKNLILPLLLLIGVLLLPIYSVLAVEFKNPLAHDTFEELLDAIIGFIFWVGITLAPVMLIIGGFLYITSGGDPNKVTTAKRWIIWTLIGVAIIILAGGLVAVIKSILGVED